LLVFNRYSVLILLCCGRFAILVGLLIGEFMGSM
jgi:hypothetical protein